MRQYDTALAEWGYYLNTFCTFTGKHPGEIERCMWSSLGKRNFLSPITKQWRAHVFENDKATETTGQVRVLSDCVAPDGKEMSIFSVEHHDDFESSHLRCERWELGRPSKPRPKFVQMLSVDIAETTDDLAGDAIPQIILSTEDITLHSSQDARIVYFGSNLYCRSNDSGFKKLDTAPERLKFLSELSSKGDYFTISSRKQASKRKQEREQDISKTRSRSVSHASNENRSSSGSDGDDESASDSNNNLSREISAHQDQEDSASDSGKSFLLGEQRVFTRKAEKFVAEIEAFNSSNSEESNSSLSAQESWSEASTETLPEEIGTRRRIDEEDDLELLGSDKDADDAVSDASVRSSLPDASSSEGSVRSMTSSIYKQHFGDLSGLPARNNRVRVHRRIRLTRQTAPLYGLADSSSDDEVAGALDQLFQPKQMANTTGEISEIQVLKIPSSLSNKADLSTKKLQPTRVFRYFEPSTGDLDASPPAFHPEHPVTAWPLGGGSLILANYIRKTYQVLRFSAEYDRSAAISIQCHFSDCGRFLHIASFEGSVEVSGSLKWPLRVHVSTYRLSRYNLSRRPRLVWHRSCELAKGPWNDKDTAKDEELPSKLPLTVTWTTKFVYFTQSKRLLTVIRIALFRDPNKTKIDGSHQRSVMKNKAELYLPASAESRKVYFFPSDSTPTEPNKGIHSAKPSAPSPRGKVLARRQPLWKTDRNKSTEEVKEEIVATLILSSENGKSAGYGAGGASGSSATETKDTAREELRPPVAMYLTDRQFGGWEPLEPRQDTAIKVLGRARTWRDGQLMSRFDAINI